MWVVPSDTNHSKKNNLRDMINVTLSKTITFKLVMIILTFEPSPANPTKCPK